MRIAARIRLFAIIIVLLSSIGAALVAYLGYTSSIADLQGESIETLSDLEVKRLSAAFGEFTRDLRFVSRLPGIQQLAEGNLSGQEKETVKEELATIFQELLEAKSHYMQLRIIGVAENGKEIVRVEQGGGRAYVVPEAELQEKGHRDYFKEAVKLSPGVAYYSQINLNRERGEIDQPVNPTMRFAMPIHSDDGNTFGIVIINLDFDAFIEDLLSKRSNRYRYYIINEDGYFLLHPNPSHTFGFDLGTDYTLKREFPAIERLFEKRENQMTFRVDSFSAGTGELIHFQKFSPFGNHRELALGIVASYEDIGRAFMAVVLKIGASTLLIIFLASLVAYVLAGRMTRSIERIQEASRHLSDGDMQEVEFLPLQLDDEIGDLANTFNEMKMAVQRHETNLISANEKLLEANRDLEHFARISSHELREPIRRIASLATLYHLEYVEGKKKDPTELLNQLQNECQRAIQQISDFSSFARISHESLVREEVALRELVEEVLEDFADSIEKRQVNIQMDELPVIDAYPSLVKVLYRNLVDNALTYAKKDGFTLKFTARPTKADTWELGVFNTGSTISEDLKLEVFQVFTKFSKRSHGTGMGLSIAKRIVDRHAGEIWFESEPDSVHIKFIFSTDNVRGESA